MISIQQADIGNILDVEKSFSTVKATVVNKPFYDPKKKIANAKI